MKFTEAKLEQAFIELLENENYPHHAGNTPIGTKEMISNRL
jgi:type I restriction enzyme R subunit